ncbi:Teichuronic acid biosynthesis protein TuaB [Dyadobacter sp. CECT 9623]|uniref:Teichuronic acid biosynthesis protein TuaB n=1 Tax=Dyadobacter linearis TaxID=2823330 RepID=A0ABN7R8P4_9BACT|nr:lipopolysaccharide biosynthesis protein [Dyadobacter sp. CECT 9623]CAG5069892.1 Teichuronic acid biosynthesis protein TuaB [Dyadobacter sp. CECT 9623]
MHIQGEIRRGTIAIFISKYSNILIGLGINSVLARLLSPGEYGILGIVTVFISFFYILSDIGIGVAIIQDQTLTQKDTSDIFKISIFLSLVLAISFALLSSAIAWYYESDVYIPIGQLLAISVFFSSMTVVPKSLLSKSRSFRLIGTIEVIVAVCTGGCAIFLASRGWSYYSIVWRSILSSIIIFFLHVYFSKLIVFKGFSLDGFRKIARYSFFQFAFNFINYFSRNLDNILIGKFMGNQSLGIYNQSYQLMMYPVSNLTHVITPVLHPVLAKFKDQPKVIFEEYLKVVNVLSMLGVPISILIFFAADEIIYILLGSKWAGVVPILRIFSVTIWLQMITSSAGAIFQAVGRTDILFKLGLFSAATIVLSIFTGVIYFNSLNATAVSLSIAFAVNFLVVFYILVSNLLRENFGAFLRIISSQLILAIVLIVSLSITERYIITNLGQPNILSLAVKVIIVGIAFLLFHFSQFLAILKRFRKTTT